MFFCFVLTLPKTLQTIPIVPASHKSTVSLFPWDIHCTVSYLWARGSGSPYTIPKIPIPLQLRGMNFPTLRTNWPVGAFILSARLSRFLYPCQDRQDAMHPPFEYPPRYAHILGLKILPFLKIGMPLCKVHGITVILEGGVSWGIEQPRVQTTWQSTIGTCHFLAYISVEKRRYISPQHQWDLSPLGLSLQYNAGFS